MGFFLLTFLLAVLLAFCGGTTNCPTGCNCNDDTLTVMCEQTRLDVLPITLNPLIKRLIIRDTNIKVIDSSIQFYSELQYLELSQNHLVNVPARTFAYQPLLQELHLNQNKISYLSSRSFEYLDSLTVLNLKQNFLEEITEGTFAVLSKLEELNLGQNRISKIEPRAFAGLFALRTLYLDNNQLSSIPTTSFSPLRNLAVLHIGSNAFTCIPDDAFAGLNRLTVLDLNNLKFYNISEFAFRGLSGIINLSAPAKNKATRLEPANNDYNENENRQLLQISLYVICGIVCSVLIGATVLIACRYSKNRTHINFEECPLDGGAELYEFPNMFYMRGDPSQPRGVETPYGPASAPVASDLSGERLLHPARIQNGLRCYENIYEDIEPYDTIDSSNLSHT